ncbi:MAG: hypothetical protein AAF311_06095 [Pseudomonadota bacterium]
MPQSRLQLESDIGAGGTFEWTLAETPNPVALSSSDQRNPELAIVRAGRYRIDAVRTLDGNRTEQTLFVDVAPNPFAPTAQTRVPDYLQSRIAPNYSDTHSLPPIASASITTHPAILAELSDDWGWGLQTPLNVDFCGPSVSGASGAPSYSGSHNDEILKLALDSGGTRKLVLGVANLLPKGDGKRWATPGLDENDQPAMRGVFAEARDFETPESVWYNDGQGNGVDSRLGRRGQPDATARDNPNFSPLAPESWVRDRIEEASSCAAKFQAEYQVELITDAAEYGFSLFDGDFCLAQNDPATLAAVGFPNDPDPSCFNTVAGQPESRNAARDSALQRLLSTQWIRNYKITRDAFAEATRRPDGSSALFNVYTDTYGTDRGRWNGWPNFIHRFEDQGADKISFAPGTEHYYLDFNTGFSGIQEQAECAATDILFKTLNDIGGSIVNGQPLRYPWISGGYNETDTDKSGIADRERWMGYTKMLFVGGAVGALPGYFNYSYNDYEGRQFRNNPIGGEVPAWLWQIEDLSRVQAAFSHLEDFLREGDLVQGRTPSGSDTHPYARDTDPVPYFALELREAEYDRPDCFNTERNYAPRAYVMARKLRNEARWLVGAWANVGADRQVTAVLPDGQELSVEARVAGSLYIAEEDSAGAMTLTLLDPEPMLPSALMFDD